MDIIAKINTAAAERSLAFPIKGSFSTVILSANASIELLIASAENTIPMQRRTTHHSMADTLKRIHAITTPIKATKCSHALCSYLRSNLIPLNAKLKDRSLFFHENLARSFISNHNQKRIRLHKAQLLLPP